MNKISIRIKKNIISYIINNFNCPIIRIDEYLMNFAEEITNNLKLEIDADDIVYELGDIHNINNKQFVELLQKEIEVRGFKSRIRCKYDAPFYYLELSEYGKMIDADLRKKIEDRFNIFNFIDNKGYKFQDFCKFFLQDFGIESIVSRRNNDNGIDIIGRNEIKVDIDFYKYFCTREKLFLIAQVKCQKEKVTTTIIKNLIQDSFILRFKENEKFFIGSNPAILSVVSYIGFTENAITYAKKHGVCLISVSDIIDSLCCVKNLESLKCMRYIEYISNLVGEK